jgi:hypothetical protein
MYYYYYYYKELTSKVKFELNFQKKEGEKVSLKELNDFLNIIGKIHKKIILVTQPEYQKKDIKLDSSEISLISYHELNVIKFCQRNPFNLTLEFNLASFGIGPYFVIWKVLINICKRYGKNTIDLQETISDCINFFEKLFLELKTERINNQINSILGVPISFENIEEFTKELNKNLQNILTNKKTVNIYNKFCSSAIFITDCVGIIEGLDLNDDKFTFIENYKE